MSNSDKFNKYFNIFILAGMTVVMVATTALKIKSGDSGAAMLIVAAFGSLMGVFSTVCSANAKILTFLFGFFDVTIYGVMCFLGGKYGNAALHLLYFLPMQFVGFFQWRKRLSVPSSSSDEGSGSEKKVSARRLTPRKRLLFAVAFLLGLALCYFILLKVGGEGSSTKILKTAILMDAFSTVCNILGQLLMSMAYMEQWFFWIGVNVASVVMWSVTLAAGDGASSYALIYIIKYSFYLLNSLNGLRIWLSLSRDPSHSGDCIFKNYS